MRTAVLGVVLHFLIATGSAIVFYAASRKWSVLVRSIGNGIVAGALFGVGVYFFMNWLVVPLSALGAKTFPPAVNIGVMLGHIPFVGIPIALIVRRGVAA